MPWQPLGPSLVKALCIHGAPKGSLRLFKKGPMHCQGLGLSKSYCLPTHRSMHVLWRAVPCCALPCLPCSALPQRLITVHTTPLPEGLVFGSEPRALSPCHASHFHARAAMKCFHSALEGASWRLSFNSAVELAVLPESHSKSEVKYAIF